VTGPGRSPPRPKKESSADADETDLTAEQSGRRLLEELAKSHRHPTLLPGVVTAGAVAAAADAVDRVPDDDSSDAVRLSEEVAAESVESGPTPAEERAAQREQVKADRAAARRAKREARERRRAERRRAREEAAQRKAADTQDEESDDGRGAAAVGAAAVATAAGAATSADRTGEDAPTLDPKAARAAARARRREKAEQRRAERMNAPTSAESTEVDDPAEPEGSRESEQPTAVDTISDDGGTVSDASDTVSDASDTVSDASDTVSDASDTVSDDGDADEAGSRDHDGDTDATAPIPVLEEDDAEDAERLEREAQQRRDEERRAAREKDEAERRKAEKAEAKRRERLEKAEAKARAKREKAEARAAARAQRDADAAARHDDDVVVAPPALAADTDDAADRTSSRVPWPTIILGIAMLALVASVVLAIGALLAAVSADTDNPIVGAISSLCDVMDGPLTGLFDFSGDNAADKERLLSRGIASMLYLAVGVLLPLVVASRDDD